MSGRVASHAVICNSNGVYVCPYCGHDEFTQEVTGVNFVAFWTDRMTGEFEESNEFMGRWEVIHQGPLLCDKCHREVSETGDTSLDISNTG